MDSRSTPISLPSRRERILAIYVLPVSISEECKLEPNLACGRSSNTRHLLRDQRSSQHVLLIPLTNYILKGRYTLTPSIYSMVSSSLLEVGRYDYRTVIYRKLNHNRELLSSTIGPGICKSSAPHYNIDHFVAPCFTRIRDT